jgi:hypothetical protein
MDRSRRRGNKELTGRKSDQGRWLVIVLQRDRGVENTAVNLIGITFMAR